MTDNLWTILYPFRAEVSALTIIGRVILETPHLLDISLKYALGYVRIFECPYDVMMTSSTVRKF